MVLQLLNNHLQFPYLHLYIFQMYLYLKSQSKMFHHITPMLFRLGLQTGYLNHVLQQHIGFQHHHEQNVQHLNSDLKTTQFHRNVLFVYKVMENHHDEIQHFEFQCQLQFVCVEKQQLQTKMNHHNVLFLQTQYLDNGLQLHQHSEFQKEFLQMNLRLLNYQQTKMNHYILMYQHSEQKFHHTLKMRLQFQYQKLVVPYKEEPYQQSKLLIFHFVFLHHMHYKLSHSYLNHQSLIVLPSKMDVQSRLNYKMLKNHFDQVYLPQNHLAP